MAEFAAFKSDMQKKDDKIATLVAMLRSKAEHKQVKMMAGGEVLELGR